MTECCQCFKPVVDRGADKQWCSAECRETYMGDTVTVPLDAAKAIDWANDWKDTKTREGNAARFLLARIEEVRVLKAALNWPQ